MEGGARRSKRGSDTTRRNRDRGDVIVSIPLPGGSGDPRRCRQATELELRGRTDADSLGDVLLVVSELVTNAVLHGEPSRSFDLRIDGDTLTVAVIDGDREGAVAMGDPQPEALRGRGLAIVDQLAHRWGVEPSGLGKRVWATFRLAPPRPLGAGDA